MRQHPASRTALLETEHQRRRESPSTTAGPGWYGILGWGSLATRLLGAVAVLVVGLIHFQAYRGPYSSVPTIGVLFLVNFLAATAIGLALALPLEHVAGRRAGLALVLVSAAGIGLAAVSLAMLFVSEHGTLFAFHEPGYDSAAISRSRTAEVAVVVLLTASLGSRALTKRRPRW
jgi:hypothetical protein